MTTATIKTNQQPEPAVLPPQRPPGAVILLASVQAVAAMSVHATNNRRMILIDNSWSGVDRSTVERCTKGGKQVRATPTRATVLSARFTTSR